MATITTKDALRALAIHLLRSIYRVISKILFKLFNFEFDTARCRP